MRYLLGPFPGVFVSLTGPVLIRRALFAPSLTSVPSVLVSCLLHPLKYPVLTKGEGRLPPLIPGRFWCLSAPVVSSVCVPSVLKGLVVEECYLSRV